MGKFKVPYDWTEAECREAVTKLLLEAGVRYNKNHYDEAAKMLIAAAQVMVKIPSIKRKEQHRVATNEKIKKQREPKVPKEDIRPHVQPEPPKDYNPFRDKS
jgi:hypothetical protein